MRGLFYPALALVAILLVAVGALVLWPDSLWPEWHKSITHFLRPSDETKAPAAATAPAAEKKNVANVKKSARPNQPQAIDVPQVVVAPPVAAPVPAAMQYPFPVAEQITAGTPQSAILARFGRPEMKVTGSERSELRERYVYVDHATGRRTFIAIVNSIVTGAQTVTQ